MFNKVFLTNLIMFAYQLQLLFNTFIYNTPQNLDTRIVIRKRKFIFAAKSD